MAQLRLHAAMKGAFLIVDLLVQGTMVEDAVGRNAMLAINACMLPIVLGVDGSIMDQYWVVRYLPATHVPTFAFSQLVLVLLRKRVERRALFCARHGGVHTVPPNVPAVMQRTCGDARADQIMLHGQHHSGRGRG